MAVTAKLDRLKNLSGGGADSLADEYISAVVSGAVEKLTNELVVFGRIDDSEAWRIGLYGIDDGSEQLVVDWRAPFAAAFYQARMGDTLGLARRVSYVGSIADLMVEDFTTGDVAGTSPLMAELARNRGAEMRTAVATLQSEQDELVRLDPEHRLVLRGGPGTGKTVVGLHRAAWLVYNDPRVTADRLLVIGPSDRFLRYVSVVLPTLGEARVTQTTFERLLGPVTKPGSDPRWVDALDRFEDELIQPQQFKVGARTVSESEIVDLLDAVSQRRLPWRDRRKVIVDRLVSRRGFDRATTSQALEVVFPSLTTKSAMARLRRGSQLAAIGLDDGVAAEWLASPEDGALLDEVRARIEGVAARYSHVIVDEAQDLSLLQLRAVQRRAKGVTLVGDDAQQSAPNPLGLARAAALLDTSVVEMRTAYRMSAEIADWLNRLAKSVGLVAVELDGIRPTGRPVREIGAANVESLRAELSVRWDTVATIGAGEVWDHKGVEYDAVVVDAFGMDSRELYLAASRAAHELCVVGGPGLGVLGHGDRT